MSILRLKRKHQNHNVDNQIFRPFSGNVLIWQCTKTEVWYPWCFENISSQNTLRSELFVNLNDLGFGFRWICKVVVFLAFEYTSLFFEKKQNGRLDMWKSSEKLFARCLSKWCILRVFFRKIMQGLFNVLEAELQSYIHFADRLDPL